MITNRAVFSDIFLLCFVGIGIIESVEKRELLITFFFVKDLNSWLKKIYPCRWKIGA